MPLALNLRMIGRMPRATPLAARNETPKVGARVRSLRRERGLTIEQLAAATGLTKGFISQLERDRTAPSLSSIARICDALGVRLSHIFERRAGAGTRPAARAARAVRRRFPTENHLLSSRDEERFQAIESVVAPGAGAGDELSSLPGEMEFVYVLAGTLELRVGEETHVLEEGDALTYPLSKPHTWRNASDDRGAPRALGLRPESVLVRRFRIRSRGSRTREDP